MDCQNCRHLTVVSLHDTGPWPKYISMGFPNSVFTGENYEDDRESPPPPPFPTIGHVPYNFTLMQEELRITYDKRERCVMDAKHFGAIG